MVCCRNSIATINTVGTCDIIQKKQFITMTAINTQVKKNWENVGHSDKTTVNFFIVYSQLS